MEIVSLLINKHDPLLFYYDSEETSQEGKKAMVGKCYWRGVIGNDLLFSCIILHAFKVRIQSQYKITRMKEF